jgi:hypothetical protein
MPSITGTLTASGDSTALITAPTGCTIRVLGYQIMGASAAITVTIKTGCNSSNPLFWCWWYFVCPWS